MEVDGISEVGLVGVARWKVGLLSEWKAFTALAVEYLGAPVEAMQMCSDDNSGPAKRLGLGSSCWSAGILGTIGRENGSEASWAERSVPSGGKQRILEGIRGRFRLIARSSFSTI